MFQPCDWSKRRHVIKYNFSHQIPISHSSFWGDIVLFWGGIVLWYSSFLVEVNLANYFWAPTEICCFAFDLIERVLKSSTLRNQRIHFSFISLSHTFISATRTRRTSQLHCWRTYVRDGPLMRVFSCKSKFARHLGPVFGINLITREIMHIIRVYIY